MMKITWITTEQAFKEVCTHILDKDLPWCSLDIETVGGNTRRLSQNVLAQTRLFGELSERLTCLKEEKKATKGRAEKLAFNEFLDSLKIDVIQQKKVCVEAIKELKNDRDALYFHSNRIALMQLYAGGDTVYLVLPRVIHFETFETFLWSLETVYIQNAKFELKNFLHHMNIEFNPETLWCTQVGETLLHSGRWGVGNKTADNSGSRYKKVSLKSLTAKYCGVELHKGLGAGTDWELEPEQYTEDMVNYAALDVTYLHEIAHRQSLQFTELNLWGTFRLEMRVLPALAEMETTGMCLDYSKLCKYNTVLTNKIEEAKGIFKESVLGSSRADLYTEELINSPTQLLSYFNSFGFGFDSVDKGIEEHSVFVPIAALLKYRKLAKVNSTYISSWLRLGVWDKQGNFVIYPDYNQNMTDTGRLSCSDPNLQNVPSQPYDIDGYIIDVRSLFLAPKGYYMVGADLSQVEMRILAAYSQDVNLINAIVSESDLHKSTAALVFNVALDMVTKDMRHKAKIVNFGIVYGKTAFGLAKELTISSAEAFVLLKKYKQKYSGITNYIDYHHAFCNKFGFVETASGRIRWIPEIHDPTPWIANHGRNAAINTPIQGTAGDSMKYSLYLTWADVRKRGLRGLVRLAQTVHDEKITVNHNSLTTSLTCAIMEENLVKGTQHYVDVLCERQGAAIGSIPIKVGDKENGFRAKVLTTWSDLK